MRFCAVLGVFSKCVCLFPENLPKFALQKHILANVNLGVNTQCNITPNSQDAFMRRGAFAVSSSVLCLHALVFCMLLIYLHTVAGAFFPIRESSKSWASSMGSTRCCTLLCLCLHYVIWISAVSWACLHPSLGEYVCVGRICASVNSPPFSLCFLPLSSCLCASAPNEHSHGINSRMIKQLQLSTYAKHGAESERETERAERVK